MRKLALDLLRALYVDIQQQILAGLFGFALEPARRAVVVTEDLGVFEEFVLAGSSLRIRYGRRRNIRVRFARCHAGDAWCRKWKNKVLPRVWRISLTSVDLPEPDGAEMM